MRHRVAAAVLVGTLVGMLAGCGTDGSGPEDEPTTLQPTTAAPEPTDSPAPTGSSEPTDSPEPPEDDTAVPTAVQKAIDDLADQLGVNAAAVQAGPLEQVTWSDGSLGCPEPGMSYPEVLTDGYRVLLIVDGEEYAYHAGAEQEFFYCADPMDPVSQDAEES